MKTRELGIQTSIGQATTGKTCGVTVGWDDWPFDNWGIVVEEYLKNAEPDCPCVCLPEGKVSRDSFKDFIAKIDARLVDGTKVELIVWSNEGRDGFITEISAELFREILQRLGKYGSAILVTFMSRNEKGHALTTGREIQNIVLDDGDLEGRASCMAYSNHNANRLLESVIREAQRNLYASR